MDKGLETARGHIDRVVNTMERRIDLDVNSYADRSQPRWRRDKSNNQGVRLLPDKRGVAVRINKCVRLPSSATAQTFSRQTQGFPPTHPKKPSLCDK